MGKYKAWTLVNNWNKQDIIYCGYLFKPGRNVVRYRIEIPGTMLENISMCHNWPEDTMLERLIVRHLTDEIKKELIEANGI